MSDETACRAVRLTREDATLVIVPDGEAPPDPGEAQGITPDIAIVTGPTKAVRLTVRPTDSGMRVSLQEQSRYALTVVASEAPKRIRTGDAWQVPVHRAGPSATFVFDTGNDVGWLDLEVEHEDGRPTGKLGPLWVAPRKLASDEDFEWLVDSLARAARAIAFDLSGTTALPWRRTAADVSHPYEDLVFLRSIVTDLEDAVTRIARRPHERLRRRSPWVDVSIGGEIDEREVVRIGGRADALAIDVSGRASSWLSPTIAQRLRTAEGHQLVPTIVPVIERYRDRDTYENRFVRFALESLRARAERIERTAVAVDAPSVVTEASRLAARCDRLLRLPFLEGVGALAGLQASSQVLMREPAYQRVFRIYLESLLASEVRWTDRELERIQEVRDIATLYEMWVFVEVVASVVRLTAGHHDGVEDVPVAIHLDETGLVVKLKQGSASAVRVVHERGATTVYYNRSYRPSSTGAWRSWSLPLRPDVSIVHADVDAPRTVVLDAKYRIEQLGGVFETDDEGDPRSATAPSSTFKRDDVYKMHTYRDALSGVHTALAVFPGTASAPTLYRDDKPGTVGGVGAVPLTPGERYDPTALDTTLRTILAI